MLHGRASLTDAESTLIIKNLGIQCSSVRVDGSSTDRLVTWEELRGVAILEAAHRFHYIFYLAAWERWPSDPANPLMVLFPARLLTRRRGNPCLGVAAPFGYSAASEG